MEDLSAFHVSSATGFLLENPATCLPNGFEAWDYLAKNVTNFVAEHKFRDEVHKVPLLNYEALTKYRDLRLAHLQLSLITAGYVWQEGEHGAAKKLPQNIAVPFYKVSEVLGLKPIVGHPSAMLCNYKLIDPHGNMDMLYELPPGGITTKWFILATIGVEIAFLPALRCIRGCLQCSVEKDEQSLTMYLKDLSIVICDMTEATSRMHEHLDASAFYNELRPFLSGWGGEGNPLPNGLIYEGITNEPQKVIGGSAAQSSTIQAIDALLGVQHKPAFQISQNNAVSEVQQDIASLALPEWPATKIDFDRRVFLNTMRQYMPPAHKRFLEEIERTSKVKEIVSESLNNDLIDAYNKCLDAVVGFRSNHIQIVTKYIVIMARKAERSNFESLSQKGTGGSDLLPFLKDLRSSTKETFM